MRILVCLGSLAVPALLPCQVGVPNSGAAAVRLAAPVQVLAGDSPLGHDRLYPSPVWHDADGDGALDLVVGDLHGRLTVARRLPGGGMPEYAAEQPLPDARGEQVDFGNW